MTIQVGGKHQVPTSRCTACGHDLDRATAVGDIGDDPAPERGDFTVCIRCGHIMVYGESQQLRDPTDDEIKEIAGNPVLLAIQKARSAAQ